MIRHAITTGDLPLVAADFIHLRAKDLPARELLARVGRLRGASAKLLVNDRIDVCLAAKADGVHLPSHRIAPRRVKDIFGAHLMIGVSCHNVEEVERAAEEGADYVFLGPIFDPISKSSYGPALGLDAIRQALRLVNIPVIALGGVTRENESACLAAGARGIAGIDYFFRRA